MARIKNETLIENQYLTHEDIQEIILKQYLLFEKRLRRISTRSTVRKY